ncbi:DUF4129 domain-containing protein [Actinomadura barringtoniae]|uniref:DUF4129 domain-containing protein n=1 Tax=Actinomadura barringtoniae TaxID=1427535 RepID=A0A939P9P7_9ACTN|nr:DUF4129 domain-containing protein [Actinomadura barringtoniae]MBO2448408.1 DUF4129 domain-containing protein [Actinomadura barringtoniae]
MIIDPIGRDEARELARRELEKPIYQRDKPSWLGRFFERLSDWLRGLFDRVSTPNAHGSTPGWISWAIIIVIALVAVALVLWVMRGRRLARSRAEALLDETPSTARDHRSAAEEYAAAGRWPEAIRERLRAIARDLEERAILGPRPGRTADELAAEAGEALPDLADDLRVGVRIFDDVWYGDRPGTADQYAELTRLDERVRATRPRPLESETGDGEGGDREPSDPGTEPWAPPVTASASTLADGGDQR